MSTDLNIHLVCNHINKEIFSIPRANDISSLKIKHLIQNRLLGMIIKGVRRKGQHN
jgi:hypothetical protein